MEKYMLNLNLKRNDKCWCGSNLKYKKCHLDRDKQQRLTLGEIKGEKSKQKPLKKCFHRSVDDANCDGKIINAHTVSKSSSLKKIARDGKIYHYKPNFNALCKNDGKFILELIGVSQASTFTGFCAYHDRTLFSPIENKEFTIDNYNCLLLGYRAITKEIHAKLSQNDNVALLKELDKGLSLIMQFNLQQTIAVYEMGLKYGLDNLNEIKKEYDQAFLQNDFSQVKYFVIEIADSANIMFSGAFYPQYDFRGIKLQDYAESIKLDSIAVNVVATATKSYIVFQWMGESDVNNKFIESLLTYTKNDWTNIITIFGFATFENLFISPDWWDGLSVEIRGNLEKKVHEGVPFNNYLPSYLVPDGKCYNNWQNPTYSHNLNI